MCAVRGPGGADRAPSTQHPGARHGRTPKTSPSDRFFAVWSGRTPRNQTQRTPQLCVLFPSRKSSVHRRNVNMGWVAKEEVRRGGGREGFPFCSVFQKCPHLGQSPSLSGVSSVRWGASRVQLPRRDVERKMLEPTDPPRESLSGHFSQKQPLRRATLYPLSECKSL